MRETSSSVRETHHVDSTFNRHPRSGPLTGSVVSLSQEAGDILNQIVEILLDNTPDNAVVNGVVSVNQNIAERDDVSVVPNPGEQIGIVSVDPVERLPDNLKLPLNRAANQLTGAVALKGLTRHELLYGACRIQDVMEMRKGFILHRSAPFLREPVS